MGKGIVNSENSCYYLCYNENTDVFDSGFCGVGGYVANGLDVLECFDTFAELQKRGNELGYNVEPIEV